MCRVKCANSLAAYVLFAAILALATFACGTSGEAAPPETAAQVEPVTAIGDSVMLAANAQLQASGFVVSAEVGRQSWEALVVLEALQRDGRLSDRVVVHIGHNGPFSQDEFERFVELVGPERELVFLTVRVPRQWEAANNAVIAAGAARHPNVRVLDFRGATDGRPELFWDDGLHLTPEGADFYTAFLVEGMR